MKAVKIIVKGLVQGVGFRYTTKMLADELKIKGKVVNMPDGSVYIEAQSTDEASLEQFIAGVESSPSPAGRVDEMDVSEMKPKEYSRFSVMYH